MLAVFINCSTVILGSILGLLLGNRIKDSFKDVIFTCCGLITIVMGLGMALESSNSLVLLVALILGGLIGHWIGIEEAVLSVGDRLERLTSKKGSSSDGSHKFAKGFLVSSVLFCSGAMSVVGSIQAGTVGDYQTILVKSVMDGCMAIIFASVYGVGVMFSSLFILVYQGFFTLAGSWLEPLLGTVGINELSAEGGVLLMMIGLGLMKIKDIKTANYLPALVFAPVFGILVSKLF